MTALVGLLLVAGLVAWSVITYNMFVKYKNLMAEAWSGIDVQLKRRADLIPNLVEAVRAYAAHERGTLDAVAALRGAPDDADPKLRADCERAVTGGLKKLIALAEAYPDLKASRDFLDLQKNLASVEDQLQMARRYYNGAVRNYNIRAESVPGNLVAWLASFRPAEYFEVESAVEREAPHVETKP